LPPVLRQRLLQLEVALASLPFGVPVELEIIFEVAE
jgi:hypothetical protein